MKYAETIRSIVESVHPNLKLSKQGPDDGMFYICREEKIEVVLEEGKACLSHYILS